MMLAPGLASEGEGRALDVVHPSTLQPGDVLNRTYRIQRPLAEGGMGMVYLATHERLPGLFVVKTLHPELASTPSAKVRLEKEAQVLASLGHPNIVKVLDFNQTESGIPYFVMEYLEGRDLKEILCTRSLHPWEAASVVRAIASALRMAHSANVVHGDLKPENVLIVPVLGQDDSVKLIDFGVSNMCLSADSDAATVVLGTPNYMSPEQISGAGASVNERSDQFSLAVMAFEMLCGEQPFGDRDEAQVLASILNSPPLDLAKRVSWSPQAVQPVLERAMSKQPGARYPSIAEFARELERALRKDIGGNPAPLRVFATLPPPPRAASGVPRDRHEDTLRLGKDRKASRPLHRSVPDPSLHGVIETTAESAAPRRRRRGRPILLAATTVAAAACVFFFPHEPPSSLVVAGRDLGGRVAQLVLQTIDRGVNKTAAQAGILKPRSSDSGSAHPFPP